MLGAKFIAQKMGRFRILRTLRTAAATAAVAVAVTAVAVAVSPLVGAKRTRLSDAKRSGAAGGSRGAVVDASITEVVFMLW